jgi:hypothetical protein
MVRRSNFLLFGVLCVQSLYAHHSDAVYDREQIVAFEATVVRYAFRNPHIMIVVETEDERGQTVEWEVETGSTPIMLRSGWTRDLLSPGDTVNIRAHPMRSGQPHAILNTLQTSDGKFWAQVEGEPRETVSADSLAGVWQPEPESGGAGALAVNPSGALALTPAGEAARDSYNRVTDDPSLQCVTRQPPFQIGSSNYLTGMEILDDRVLMRNEFFNAVRTIYTDGRSHPENAAPANLGHSIGWWEDDVFVVDTRNFAGHRFGNHTSGVPSSTQKHLVERISLSDDGMRAIIDYMIEDPEFLTEPLVGQTTLIYSPHLQLYSYECTLQAGN